MKPFKNYMYIYTDTKYYKIVNLKICKSKSVCNVKNADIPMQCHVL